MSDEDLRKAAASPEGGPAESASRVSEPQAVAPPAGPASATPERPEDWLSANDLIRASDLLGEEAGSTAPGASARAEAEKPAAWASHQSGSDGLPEILEIEVEEVPSASKIAASKIAASSHGAARTASLGRREADEDARATVPSGRGDAASQNPEAAQTWLSPEDLRAAAEMSDASLDPDAHRKAVALVPVVLPPQPQPQPQPQQAHHHPRHQHQHHHQARRFERAPEWVDDDMIDDFEGDDDIAETDNRQGTARGERPRKATDGLAGRVRNVGLGWAGNGKVWIVGALATVLFGLSLWSTQHLIAALRRSPRMIAVQEVPAPTEAPYAGISADVYVGQGRLLRFDDVADSVFIADPAIADVRVVAPDLVYVYGKKSGTTNLIATAGEERPGYPSEDKVRASVRIRVIHDASAPNDAVRELKPDSEARLTLFGKRVVATGKAKTVDEAVDIANIAQTYSPQGQPPINNTTVEGAQQINIRVRFAEVSRSQLESLGVDWNILVNGGNFLFGMVTGSGGGGGGGSGAGLGFSSGNFDVNVFLEALQRTGVLTILAEPNLTALTGETASFLAGGEIPIPIPQSADVITVQYKQFGVALEFSPTIVRQNRISMRVKPEVSTVSTASAVKMRGFEMPAFTVRRADTTVDMASGQTFAIAGLFQRQMSRDIEKFPLLGDVPVLGNLFRSERYRRNETELIILITPYLVNPVSDKSLATPLDRVEPEPPIAQPAPRVSAKDPVSKSSSGLIFK